MPVPVPDLLRRLTTLLLFALAWTLPAVPALAAEPSVAFVYAKDAPLAELHAFDIAVVDPDHGFDPRSYRGPDGQPDTAGSELFAYVSIGEIHASRSWAARVPASWRIATNAAWASEVIDQAAPGWAEFVADTIVAPLWEKGYRGLFLDTLDSYRLASGADMAAQQAGIVRTLRHLRARFPGIRLILNRGFEFLPQLRGEVYAVAAESLYRGWNAGTGRYQEVSEADRAWLSGQLKRARDEFGLPAIAIDYVPPQQRQLARETARRIKADGFIPWVADGALATLGVGSVEVIPRRVMVLHDGREAPQLNYANAHRFLEMPLNHLGYVVDYVDVNSPLPATVDGRYAAIVTWFGGELQPATRLRLAPWLATRIDEGLRIGMFGDLGHLRTPGLAETTGLKVQPAARGSVQIIHRSPAVGFELEAIPGPPVTPLAGEGEGFSPWLSLKDSAGQRFDPVLITPWGGLLPSRYAVVEMPGGIEQSRWVTDPFAFLQAALALPPLPAPDTTTETGRRLFFAHIDGDGFPSRAELPGLPLGAEVLLTEVLTRYTLPHAMSVIEAEVAPHGLYPREAPAMEAAARRIFALPNVEIATHTYTHPFFWAEVDKGRPSTAAQGYTLAPPGYTPNLEREIIGSTEYIRQRLAPAGKPVRLLLWSGNAAPTLRALAIAEGAGLLTMNGGNTIASRTYPSLTAVGPLGIRLGEHFQAYAPIMNENVFTNLWTGPFYGFERVIETFRFTGSPRRIKPIDIYYHTYSATKRASLNALHKVYSWALAQPIHPVFPSEFVEKANNFNTLVLARPIDRDAILVRNATHLRTLRVPPQLGLPNLATGNGVAGWLKGEEGYYLHLAGSTAELRLTPTPPALPMLASANARLAGWARSGGAIRFRLAGHAPLEFDLANVAGCTLSMAGSPLAPTGSDKRLTHYRTSHAAADFDLRCPRQ
ncbi:MAG: hypothetical protein RLZZ220_913 [Pseudomonadota bacterium]